MSQLDSQLLSQMMGAGKYRDAEPVARRLLASNAHDIAATEALVEILRRAKRWDEMVPVAEHLEKLAPQSPVLHMTLGIVAMEQQDFTGAQKHFQDVLRYAPDHLTAPMELSRAYLENAEHDQAVAALDAFLQKNPNSEEALYRRSIVLRRMGRLEEALADAERAVKMNPNRPRVLSALGDVLVDLNRFKEADEILARAVRIDPSSVGMSRATLFLKQGDYPTGWKEYDTAVRAQPKHSRSDIPGVAWTGQPLKDKTILLYEDQGYGDTIMFIRYAEMLAGRGANVFVEVRSPLKQIISRVKGVAWTYVTGTERPKYDYHASIIHLPRLCNTKLSNIPAKVPYIQAPARLIEAWREKVAPAPLRVGLCWFGNKDQAENRRRSIPAEMLIPLGEVADVAYYSLQRQAPAEELAKIAGPLRLIDHTSQLNDFADTAALMANLDLVISVCTSITHLAGAVGRPVWTLLNRAAEWRWLHGREDTPWYPTMRLFRQPDATGWPALIARVKEELLNCPRPR